MVEPPGKVKRIDMPLFKLHNWRRPMGWCAAYYKSNFHPGHLPFPGGYDNQPAWVIHDLNIYLRGIAWQMGEREDLAEQNRDDQIWHPLNE